MNTTIGGGAIRKLSTTRGYAGGGLLDRIKSAVGIKTDSPELAAYKANAAAERAAAKAPAAPATTTPSVQPLTAIGSYAANTALADREKAAGLKRGGAIKGPVGAMARMAQKTVAKKPSPPQRKMVDATPKSKPEPKAEPVPSEDQFAETGYKAGGAIRKMAQKKSAEGAKLSGPGTATSDSIPATVVDTGEPIKVATGERIISKKQDSFLLEQAKADGFDSIDAWLEAGTGQPVGPTIKYSGGGKMAHAAGGMGIDPNMGMFNGGDPYAIPGYTPDMIQRSGIGLAGYNPLTQGQTLNVPQIGGDVNADKIKETEAKGFKCGGAIKKMASGGVVGQLVKLPFISTGYDHSKVQSLGPGLRGAAQGASPEDLHNDALAKAQALAAARASGAMPTPASEASGRDAYLNTVEKGSPSYFQQPTPSSNQAKMAASGALENVYSTPQAAPTPATPAAPATTYQPSKDPAGYAGGALPTPATSAAAPGAIARLSNADGKDVGYGVTRFDVPGKSPLFTNMTDAAGMASNEKLINRGPVSAQNQTALNGIQQRQDIGDMARAQKAQYDAEVAGARAINTAPERYDPEAGVRAINDLTSQTSKAIHNLSTVDKRGRLAPGAEKQLDAIYKQALGGPQAVHIADQRNATDMRGQDVQARGQDINAANAGAITQIARQRLGLETNQDNRAASQAARADRAQQRIESLHTDYLNAKGKEKEALAEQLRELTGKNRPEQWQALALPGSTDAMGNKTEAVLAAVNKGTGEMRKFDQGNGALPPGMVKQVGTSGGKPVYEDANGKRHY